MGCSGRGNWSKKSLMVFQSNKVVEMMIKACGIDVQCSVPWACHVLQCKMYEDLSVMSEVEKLNVVFVCVMYTITNVSICVSVDVR